MAAGMPAQLLTEGEVQGIRLRVEEGIDESLALVGVALPEIDD